MNEVVRKNRGKLLTFLLLVNLAYILWTAYLNLNYFNSPASNNGMYSLIWVKIWFILSYIGAIAAPIGIFLWKRWGAYLFFGTHILSMIAFVILIETNIIPVELGTSSLVRILLWIILLLISGMILIPWFIAIKRKWAFFE